MSQQPQPPLAIDQALALLQWQIEMGADEAIGPLALDRLAAPAPVAAPQAARPAPRATPPRAAFASPTAVAPPRALTESAAEPAQSARALAAQADSIEALAAI